MNKTDKKLLEKIENEGGIWVARIYGIQGADFKDKELGNLWDEALAKMNKLCDWLEEND